MKYVRTLVSSLLAFSLTVPVAVYAEEEKSAPEAKYRSEKYEGEPFSTMPIPELPAFPGAEGYGARSIGGRGGKVIKVTNLKGGGPGSLQWACAQKGSRIVVFEVSGVIPCSRSSKGKRFLAFDHGNITIAGQTAPGAGITVEGTISTLRGKARYGDTGIPNIIIRFLRARPNPTRRGNIRGLELSKSDRTIVDHVSACWSLDDCYDLYTTKDATVQYCTAEESDIQLEGGDEPHDFGMIFGYGHRSKSIHHTLLANHRHRNPLVGTYPTDFRNNVVHNGGTNLSYIIKSKYAEGFIMNLVGNYSSEGPGGMIGGRIYIPPQMSGRSGFGISSTGKFYHVGNYHPWGPGYTTNSSSNKRYASHFSERELKFPPVTTHVAEEAYRLVVAHAGCLPRDVVAQRTIQNMLCGLGGWGRFGPEGSLMEGLTPGKAPADSDDDGIPDEWEKAHSLDPNDPSDNNKTVPAGASPGDRHKGYTWIEYYINELADLKVAAALTAYRYDPIPAEPWDKPAKKLAPHAATHKTVSAMVEAIKAQTADKGRGTGPAWYAVQQMSRMGAEAAEAVPGLIKILEDPGSEPRQAAFAAWGLGAIGPAAKEAVPALIKAIDTQYKKPAKRWKPWYTAGFFAWALGRIGPEAREAVPALVKVMKGRCARSRSNGAWALGKIGPDAAPAVDDLAGSLGDRGAGRHACKALAAVGEKAVPKLTAIVDSGRARSLDLAIRALGNIGKKAESAVPALIKSLAHKEARVRREAALALGSIGPEGPEAAAAVAVLLKDTDFNVRHGAAKGLGMLKTSAKGQVDALGKSLEDTRNEVVRAAALALGEIGEPACSVLGKALSGSENPIARKYAARALGGCGAGAVPSLRKALGDADASVRCEAVWSIGELGKAAAAAAGDCKKLVDNDPDYLVRSAAQAALDRIR